MICFYESLGPDHAEEFKQKVREKQMHDFPTLKILYYCMNQYKVNLNELKVDKNFKDALSFFLTIIRVKFMNILDEHEKKTLSLDEGDKLETMLDKDEHKKFMLHVRDDRTESG